MSAIYRALLRLYPVDCAAWCAPEMLDAFESAVEERGATVRFLLREYFGLVRGAADAWVAKFTSARYMRGFWLPTKMRPPGKTWEEWCPREARVLSDVIESQRRRS
jgi:hypothetical protein